MNKLCFISDHLGRSLLLILIFLAVKPVVFAYPAGYVPCLPGTGGDLATTNSPTLTITVDVTNQAQTIHGFGASDAWSTQFVGENWPLEKREAIADLLFETGIDGNNDPHGIGLSSWRFNLGAGSSRQNNISDQWRRADTFLNDAFTGYDWARLPGQRWFLQSAVDHGVEKLTAFVNSPPTNMTKNGKAYCDSSSGSTNLESDKMDDYGVYLATILNHFAGEGINFDYVSPVNEPEWNWEGGQEGCRYDRSDIATVVDAVYAEFQSAGVATEMEVLDSGEIRNLYGSNSYDFIDKFFGTKSSDYVGDKVTNTITGHSYWSVMSGEIVSERQTLRNKLDQYPGLGYSMTEYCILEENGNGRDLGIDSALYIARVIHFDMTVAQASSWDWWLAVSPYDYKDGLVYIDYNKNNGNYYDSKMLWAMGNYSRFVRPGMKHINVLRSDGATPDDTVEGLMISSYYDPNDAVVATVFVNWTNSNKLVELNYNNLPADKPINYIVPYVTSSTDDLTAYAALNVEDTLEIPSKSVVTVVSMHITLGDLEPDGDVDIDDVLIMASQWLQTGSGLSANISVPADGTVNLKDFLVLSGNWLYGTNP